jgi:chromosome segregation ATPase
MVNFHARNGAGDLLARYSFIEPLLTGRRVLEVGAAAATEGATALFLAERGAAAVLSVDEPGEALDAAREAARHPFVQVRPGRAEDLPRGAFDLVLVADGTSLAADPARVSALKGLLARGGHLVTAIAAGGSAGLADLAGEAPAPEPPAYETFAGALADQFPVVEVATQSPTLGWVVAMSAGDEEPEISIDGGLAGDPEAAYYVAVCGDAPSGLSGLTIVALPTRPLLDGVRERLGRGDAGAARAEIEALRAAAERVPQLEAELEAERESAFELRADVDRRESVAHAAAAELAQLRTAGAEAEAALQGARSEAQAARAALEAALERAVAAEGRAAELEESLDDRARSAEVERQAAEEARARIAALEEDLARAREEAGEARVEADLARGDADQMREAAARAEAGVAGNAERVAALEAEIEAVRHEREAALAARAGAEAERDGLRVELEAERARAADAGTRSAEAERLAAEVARLEAAAAEGTSVREALEAQLAEMSARVEAEEERRRIAEAREAEARALQEQAAEAVAAADRSEEIAGLRRQVEERARAVSASEMALMAARNAAEATQAQAAELEAELQAIRWEKDEIEQRLEAAQQVGAIGSAGEVARLREELGEKGAELEGLREKIARLEAALEARAAGSAEGAAPDAETGPPPGEADGLARERDALQAAVAERDGRIQRLQREVADKTERLGRLAREVGELKARVLR